MSTVIRNIIQHCFYFASSFSKDSTNGLEVSNSGLGGAGENNVVQPPNVNPSAKSAVAGHNDCIGFILRDKSNVFPFVSSNSTMDEEYFTRC